MSSRQHRLFKEYPLRGLAMISTGPAPTPYHIYDGYGAFIGGTAGLTAVQQLLRAENVSPIQTTDGQALMGIWACDFTEASLGPHHELQFSFFVSDIDAKPAASHPLSLLTLLATRPDMQMLCHGLWNNTPAAVAYNRELLSLNARLTKSRIEKRANEFRFLFDDNASGRRLIVGRFRNPKRMSFRANRDMIAKVGIRKLWAITRQPWLGLRILNPIGVGLARNAVAETYTKNDTTVVRYFNDAADQLDFGDTPYARLNFRPQFVQYMEGFKFVYLPPG